MAFSLPELLVSTLVVLVPLNFYFNSRTRRSMNPLHPMDWPIVGMLPSLVANLHNLHDYLTIVLAASGHNFKANGPLATSMQFFVTCDPANVRHIFTSNHANYPKGEEFAEIFDVLSGSFFTVDGESCRRQRAKIQCVLSSPRLLALMAGCCCDKVENCLLPFLTCKASTKTPFDMHDLIMRFVFDLTASLVFGVDPGRLSPDMPPVPVAVAMDTVMEVALFRHTLPASCRKMMRRLKIGPERKLAAAHTVLREFITEMMETRKASRVGDGEQEAAASGDIMSAYTNDPDYNDNLLRATVISYMIAGRDAIGATLPWFFYNLAKNPRVVSSIRDELSPIASRKAANAGSNSAIMVFEPEETKSLVYLKACLFESLRLYPPGPIERKTVVADDVMPSGHEVRAGDTVLISLYAMGRMEDVWGKDCRDYRPERWLPEDGSKLRYVPSHKFLAFNSGPRMCLGKDIAIMQMKTIVAAVVWNFDLEVLEGQAVEPKLSCILQMRNGLMVNVKKREA